MLIKARRICVITLMCLLFQQLDLHNSQGDEQKLSSTTFMSLIDNRELFHGERAEPLTAPASSRQQEQRLSPLAIVTSHIPAQSVISMPPPLVELPVDRPTFHKKRTMENDNNRSPPSELTMKTNITNTANDETVDKLNHRVQRDQDSGSQARVVATITTELPNLVLVTDEIHSDQIYISDPALSSDFKASEKANKKKGKSILEWLKDKHHLKHAIGQTVLSEIETKKLGGDRIVADGHKNLAASSIVDAKVPTPGPESIGADKLSIILLEDRLIADNATIGSKSRGTVDKSVPSMITSVLWSPTTPLQPQPQVISIDKKHTTDPCTTDHKALCFSRFLFGNSHPNLKKKISKNEVASKTDLGHLISGERASRIVPSSINADPGQRFMHFG